ncbi:hypothetical protein DY000_02020766 [Brassica cretica]|uniref:Uncharacterized protein n=1 Tax=Brassica cretica TaxID=69181 RepID=A0ABQ7EHF5_BRACR|nr:hypothetical protein DY000_02020766 [Brassica cretica]
MLGMFWGGLVFPRPRIQRVQGNPLFAGSEDSDRWDHGLWLSDYTTDIADREEEYEVTRAQVLTLSPKSGLGTGLGLVCIWLLFPLLEARSWQDAKSNLVTVALGKHDRIAWCWTLGPPV